MTSNDDADLARAARKYSIKRIAAQAGVSKATVDRVLHRRGQVHYQTSQRVRQAIGELENQDLAGPASGRTVYIDVIMHAPKRFSDAVSQALNAELKSLAPYRFSPRLHLFETIDVPAMAQLMRRCARRGTQGVVLKAPDEGLINAAIQSLVEEYDIPVLTLVTDLPQSRRLTYIGMDNRAAGRTAAYLASQWLRRSNLAPAKMAVVLSSSSFRGEEEREMGFRRWLRDRQADIEVIEVSGGYGVYRSTHDRMIDTLRQHPDLTGVYSVGGGNSAILDAFDTLQRPLELFIGHDLDLENRQLLLEEKIHAVIEHDLRADMRHACLQILAAHGYLHPDHRPTPDRPSPIRIVTPFNLEFTG